MQQTMDKVYGYIVEYGVSLIAAILTFVIGRWIARLALKLSERMMQRAKVNETLASFAKHIIYFGILIFAVIAALNKLGIQTSSFVALVGAAGLAVGLALQGSLANFAAGVMIILLQPFEVGDLVEAGGATGTVKEIQIFTTILISPDNKRCIVPNAKITADKIIVNPRK